MTSITELLPRLGPGIGWRSELALMIDRHRDLGFVEVLAEDLDASGPLPATIDRLRDRGVTVIPHGVTLSLGGAEPIDRTRLEALAQLATRLDAPLVSEHIAFVRAGGVEAGHLLPLPRTREMLELLVANVCTAQRALPVPLALENVATLLDWPHPEMDEATFLTEVLERTGALLLLDIANVHANARNHGWDPLAYLDRIPLDRVAYVHIAGGVEREGLYHDTHAHPIAAARVRPARRTGGPHSPSRRPPGARRPLPGADEVAAELEAIAAAVARGDARRGDGA